MFRIKVIAWLNKEANKENHNSQGSTGGRSYNSATIGRGPTYMHHQSRIPIASPSTHVTPDLNSPNATYQQRTPNLPFMSRVLAMNTTPHAKKGIIQNKPPTQMFASENNASMSSNASTSMPLPRPAVPTPTPHKGISSKTFDTHALPQQNIHLRRQHL
jgi:hypothetical protein